MAFERNNAAEDFETMLRQHLARSGRLTASCAGFDPEAVSAYLEGALSSTARLRVEEHLAACSACRHDLIELRRLMPAAEVQQVPAPSRHPLFDWVLSLRDGLSAQGQGWRWGMLAAAGACVAVAAISVILVRREGGSVAPAGQIAMIRTSPEAAPQAAQIGTPESEPQRVVASPRPSTNSDAKRGRFLAGNAGAAPQGATSVGGLARTQSSLSAMNVISGRVSDSGGAAVAQAQVTLADAASQQARASTQTDARGQFNFNDLPGGDYRVTVQAQGFKSQQIANVRADVRQELSVKLDSGDSAENLALLSPSAKAAAPGNEKQENARRDAPAKAVDSITVSSGTAEGKDRPPRAAGAYGLAGRGGTSKAKRPQPTPTPARSTEDENFHALTRKVRDKTFRFDRSIWIDQDYKPENGLPRARLTRGSAEFDRILTDIPALGPFFDLGQVIVVWQNKVYEVRK